LKTVCGFVKNSRSLSKSYARRLIIRKESGEAPKEYNFQSVFTHIRTNYVFSSEIYTLGW
jgi:hypothetical protein